MLLVVKKTSCNSSKELAVYSAVGYITTVDGTEREYIEEDVEIGSIYISQCQSSHPVDGNIKINGKEIPIEFARVKADKWTGQAGKKRNGYMRSGGKIKYCIEEKLFEKSSFWIFKSGYTYFELSSEDGKTKNIIKDICFASDMHYYYIYDASNSLIAVIYKPYRKQGKDEYHVYATAIADMESLLFLVSYIDYYQYPYDSGSAYDNLENYKYYDDDAAYHISADDLLELYDENFTRSVILNGS